MSQEIYASWSTHHKRYSSSEIRKQKEKALQSYKQIATLEALSKKEQELASTKAEVALDQFITSTHLDNGK